MSRGAWAAVVLTVAIAFRIHAAAQSPTSAPTSTPKGTGLILGQVIDGSSERPMASVVVSLRIPAPPGTPPPTGMQPSAPQSANAITDANGRFVFRDLPAGRYTFQIGASADLVGGYGMRRPGGSTLPFELTDGQRAGDVTLRAWRTGSVSGTVVDQDGEPLVETRVTLLRVDFVAGHRRYRVGPTSMTDDRGMYRISRVEPGEYTAYLPYTQVTVPLAVQAEYDAASARGYAARQEFERTSGVSSTNVNGSGLRIGDYLLVRSSNSYGADGQVGPSFMSPPVDATGHVRVYPMSFYQGRTALSEATTFIVESGQDRVGTDLQTRLVPAVHVSGRVISADGPEPMAIVRLVAQSAVDAANETGIETATTVANAAGEFMFLGVPAGSYVLKVARVPNTTRPQQIQVVTVGNTQMMSVVDDSNLPPLPLPDTPTESVSMPIEVGEQDIRSLVVQLQRGPRLTGRVSYDGTSPVLTPDQLVRVTVALDPVDGRTYPGAVGKGLFDASGQFKTLGLLPGRYVLRLGGNLGPWSLATPDQPISIATADVPNVVITLTDRPSSLSGSVRDARSGQSDTNAAVLVFPAARTSWTDTTASPRRMRSVRVSMRGSYQIDNLPIGDYWVVAIDDRFSANWQDPQRLETLARSATRVTLGAGARQTLDLTTLVLR